MRNENFGRYLVDERGEESDTSATLFFVQVNLGKTERHDEALQILLHVN